MSAKHKEPEKPLVYEPPDLEGRQHVAKVTNDFRIREDECLADRLQNEEFEYHFGQNKSERWLGKMDLKKAKQIYLQEVERAGLLSKEEMKSLCSQDTALASEISAQLNNKKSLDTQQKAAFEMQDEEFARYLEGRERKRYEIERRQRLEKRRAQEEATREKLQKEQSQNVNDIRKQRPPPKEDWKVQCESSPRSKGMPSQDKQRVATGTGDDEKHQREIEDLLEKERQELKDKEIAKRLQLREVKLSKQKTIEEDDRKLAMRLQQQEALNYKQAKQHERDMRRTQSERRPDDDDDPRYADNGHHRHRVAAEEPQANREQIRRKATEQPSSQQHRSNKYDEDVDEEYHRQQQQQQKQQQQQQQQQRQKRIEGEPIYLKAVDSPQLKKLSTSNKDSDHKNTKENRHRQNDVKHRDDDHKQPSNIDCERENGNQEEIYRRTREEQQQSTKSSSHSRNGKENNRERHNSNKLAGSIESPRLVDDQMLLRQQARDVSRVVRGNDSSSSHDQQQSSSSSSRKKNDQQHQQQQSTRKQQQQTRKHQDMEYVKNTRPSGHARDTRHEIFYEPEKNNSQSAMAAIDYTNVARNIDPTYREPDYQTIPSGGLRGQIGILDVDSPLSRVPPVAVPQNVKRSSKKDDQKKKTKKWF